jgi:hypothetical protein
MGTGRCSGLQLKIELVLLVEFSYSKGTSCILECPDAVS